MSFENSEKSYERYIETKTLLYDIRKTNKEIQLDKLKAEYPIVLGDIKVDEKKGFAVLVKYPTYRIAITKERHDKMVGEDKTLKEVIQSFGEYEVYLDNNNYHIICNGFELKDNEKNKNELVKFFNLDESKVYTDIRLDHIYNVKSNEDGNIEIF